MVGTGRSGGPEIPAGMELVIEHPDNLDIHTGEFHGKVTGVDENP